MDGGPSAKADHPVRFCASHQRLCSRGKGQFHSVLKDAQESEDSTALRLLPSLKEVRMLMSWYPPVEPVESTDNGTQQGKVNMSLEHQKSSICAPYSTSPVVSYAHGTVWHRSAGASHSCIEFSFTFPLYPWTFFSRTPRTCAVPAPSPPGSSFLATRGWMT